MHPFYAETMMRANERELGRRLERAHRVGKAAAPRRHTGEPVTLRLARQEDAPALQRLAQLESRPEPRGSYVLAEIDGDVVAALPLPAGEMLGDPFRATAHLRPLLELRADQLAKARLRRRPIALWGAIRAWSGG